MQRDAGKWLEDILTEGKDALEFLAGKSQEDYLVDKGLRAMVERKLFVVGEAIAQLRTQFPEVADGLPDVREVVGFRNLLAHGYFALDHRRVYDIATASLPPLLKEAESVLKRFP
jgi:uncharacterized protein with HEPN domain